MGRRFDPAGQPLGEPFHVNQWTNDRQVKPSVAIDPDGDFVVVWQSWTNPGGNIYDVYARRYDASGPPVSDEFRVNQEAYYRQESADLAMRADGSFFVTWESMTGFGDGGIMLRGFDPDGQPITDEITVDFGVVRNPSIAVAGNGTIIVTYLSLSEVRACVYAPDLTPLGNPTRVDSGAGAGTDRVVVAANASGGFTIAWDQNREPVWGSPSDIFVREFDAAGIPVGDPFRVNSLSSYPFNDRPAIAMDPDGDYVVTWYSSPGSSSHDLPMILAQRFAHPPSVRESGFDYNTSRQQLRFTFSEDVSGGLTSSALQLVNLTSGQTIDPVAIELAWDSATFTATFRFTGFRGGMLPDGRYRATLPAAAVTDPAANPMLEDVSLDFFVLAGDANHDARVDAADLGILASNWQQSPRTFSQADFNYDGVVDVADLGILASSWQKQLAAPSAPAPASRGEARAVRPVDRVIQLIPT